MTRVAIAIIIWNNADDGIECAESLLEQSITRDMKIVFIDNDSSEATVDQIQAFVSKQSASQFTLVKTGYNGGTAGGFNAAVEWARENNIEYVGALNADAIADPKWCESLINELDAYPKSGIVTGTVLHRDGKTIDSTGDFYTTWGLPSPRGRYQPADSAPNDSGYIFGATGGCFIARTAMYEIVGRYDEKMFMYYEDVDMSFRAQLAGFTARYTPKAITYHTRGASADTVPGLAAYNTFKNLPILFVKNVPLGLWWRIYPRFVLAYSLILASAVKNGRSIPALKGWLMSWRYLYYSFVQRRSVQKKRVVSIQYLDSIIFQGIPPDQTGLRQFRNFFKR